MNIFNIRIFQFILFPFCLVYGIIIGIRNILYDKEYFRSLKIEKCKLISVGNISVGGTGKTPVIKFLAIYLSQMGFKVAILSRGYRRRSKGTVIVSDGKQILTGADNSGDEPYLLARQLRNIPIVVEGDRYKGSLLIYKKFKPDIILLDDAYQHRRIHRDLDILLIDASVGFGHGLLIPAGFLREPICSLKRADLIWLTRIDQSNIFDKLLQKVHHYSSSPIVTSNHHPIEIVSANTGERFELSYLNHRQVFLFSGIGNPTSFEKTVENLGAKVIYHLKFPDHYYYTINDIKNIIHKSQKADVDLILTTEKDYIRINELTQRLSELYYLIIDIQLGIYEDALKDILEKIIFKI